MILSIDPGPEESGFTCIDSDNFKPLGFGKYVNWQVFGCIRHAIPVIEHLVIEKPVCQRHSGSSISETAIQAGIFAGQFNIKNTYLITRSKVKGRLLGKVRGRTADSLIISYLAGRFAPDTSNRGKGKKSDPGFFYGFSADVWQAYALGVVFLDMLKSGKKKDNDYLLEGRV